MDESNTNCPKCSAEMEEGFILDQTYGANLPSNWIEGEPVKSFWSGTKISDKKHYQVKTLRCVRCGFLESYATEVQTENSIFT
jgi:predicted nucleic-acid-binding Zn-ribbon protein